MYPLVRELAGDGNTVALTCRVLKYARQPTAHLADALFYQRNARSVQPGLRKETSPGLPSVRFASTGRACSLTRRFLSPTTLDSSRTDTC